MFLIIGIWGGKRRVYASFKFFLYTLVGSLLMLLAILAMYLQTGTTDIEVLLRTAHFSPALQTWLWLAFFASFAVKMPMWPVHTWLPDAHVEAPTAGSVILAGILLKMGGYGFLRFSLPMMPHASLVFAPLVFVLSVVAVIYTSLVALAQEDMKKLIAYSSVAHMGLVTMGIFSLTQQGIDGGIFQMLSHGIISGALFLCVGVVYDRMHTREISAYGGLVERMPVYAACFMVFTLANMGLPGTSGFVGEFLTMLGTFQVNTWVVVFAATGVILSAAYMLYLYGRIIFGALVKPALKTIQDLSVREIAILTPLVAFTIILGVYPKIVLDETSASVAHLVAQEKAALGTLPTQVAARRSHREMLVLASERTRTPTLAIAGRSRSSRRPLEWMYFASHGRAEARRRAAGSTPAMERIRSGRDERDRFRPAGAVAGVFARARRHGTLDDRRHGGTKRLPRDFDFRRLRPRCRRVVRLRATHGCEPRLRRRLCRRWLCALRQAARAARICADDRHVHGVSRAGKHREFRIPRAGASVERRHAADGLGFELHRSLSRFRVAEPLAVCPRRHQPRFVAVERGGAEIFRLGRALIGHDAVRHFLYLRLFRNDGFRRCGARRVACRRQHRRDLRSGVPDRRPRFQSLGGAVPHVDAGRLRRLADADHRLLFHGAEGGGDGAVRAGHAAGLSRRDPGVAADRHLRFGAVDVPWRGCRDRPDQYQASDGLQFDFAHGLRADGHCRGHASRHRRRAHLSGDLRRHQRRRFRLHSGDAARHTR